MTTDKSINNSANNSANNKRIAKNTAMLYVRTIFSLLVTLYTSRVVLNVLGVNDFGIYNVVGGVVSMFSILNSTMAAATQRFLSFELGKKNYEQLKRVFNLSLTIHTVIAFVVLFLAETIGLWFFYTQMNIPLERIDAAFWVYQCSVLSLILTFISVPYNAALIARENMKAYAYIGILEVVLKLLIALLIQFVVFDKLKLYSVFVFFVALIIRFIYSIYCKRKYEECSFSLYWDNKLFKTMSGFAGWNLFGTVAWMANNQGINVLLNIFFGPAVNASRGIAYQISGAIQSFVMSFQNSINPQITKSYASGDRNYMNSLIFKGSKFSYFMLLLLSLPVLLDTHYILQLWLKQVPDKAVIFTILVIINALVDVLSGTMMTGVQATGNIKIYQSVVGGMLLLNLPISYVFLKTGFDAEVTMIISILSSLLCLFLRLFILNRLIKISITKFVESVLTPVVLVTLLSLFLPYLVKMSLIENFQRFILISLFSAITSILSIYFIGLKKNERQLALVAFKKIKEKINNNYHY